MAVLLRVLVVLSFFAAPAAHAALFQCFYEDGSTQYSDSNCPGAVAQVDTSLKGSWMMRKPKGSNCKVVCDADRCSCRRTQIKIFNKKDAVLEAMRKLPQAHLRQRSAIQNCRNCRKKHRRASSVNACDLVVYQTVIKQFYRAVSKQMASDLRSTKLEFDAATSSCDGPNAAKPKRETPYGELLSCKEQSEYRIAVTQSRLMYHRAQREFTELKAGATALELKLPS